MTALREPGDTPLTWACLSGLYMNSTAGRQAAAGAVPAQARGRARDQPGPWGVTPFMYSAALNDSDPGQEKIALALLDAGSPDLKRRLNAQARGVGFLSLSPAIYERLIKAGCDVNERFFESKQSPLHLVCTKEKPAERLIPLIELLIKAGADPNQPGRGRPDAADGLQLSGDSRLPHGQRRPIPPFATMTARPPMTST